MTLALRPEGIQLGDGPEGSNRLRGTIDDINFLGSIVRIRIHLNDGADGKAPTSIALDTFNEPHLMVPTVGADVDRLVPARGLLRARRVARQRRGIRGRRRDGVTVRLDGIDLVIFDKDGTIIEFGSMWSGWAVAIADALRAARRPVASTGRSSRCSATTPATGVVRPGGGLAATPMARLRERTRDVLVDEGLTDAEAERALAAAWHAPDPVGLARPLADLPALFGRLRDAGRRVAIATSDDREPDRADARRASG